MKAIAEAPATTRTESRMRNPSVRAYLALALGALCIGFSAIFTKWANVPGPVAGVYRVGIATTVLVVPFLVQTSRRRSQKQDGVSSRPLWAESTGPLLWGTALAGLFFALDLALWNTSLLFTNAANSTLLGNTSTLWVSIGAMLFFGA